MMNIRKHNEGPETMTATGSIYPDQSNRTHTWQHTHTYMYKQRKLWRLKNDTAKADKRSKEEIKIIITFIKNHTRRKVVGDSIEELKKEYQYFQTWIPSLSYSQIHSSPLPIQLGVLFKMPRAQFLLYNYSQLCGLPLEHSQLISWWHQLISDEKLIIRILSILSLQ